MIQRDTLIQLLDNAMAYIENPGLYSDKELTTLLDTIQDAVDANSTTLDTWE